MPATQCRVELKNLPPNASQDMKERAFRGMFSAFKRRVNDLGILTEYNLKSTYESRGQKTRRKRKEADMRRLKEDSLRDRLRENFGQG
jgi:ribosomal protein S21